MGNSICFQSDPTDLKTFCDSLRSSPQRSLSLTKNSSPSPLTTPRESGTQNNQDLILMWEFSAEKKTNVSATPVKITEFDLFKPNCSYLVLRLFPTHTAPSSPNYPPRPQKTLSFGSLQNQKKNGDFLKSLSKTKATFVDNAVYLWNGTDVGVFLKALSFSKCCELRTCLSQTSNSILQTIFFSQKTPQCSQILHPTVSFVNSARIWSLFSVSRAETQPDMIIVPNPRNLLFSISSDKPTAIQTLDPPTIGIIVHQQTPLKTRLLNSVSERITTSLTEAKSEISSDDSDSEDDSDDDSESEESESESESESEDSESESEEESPSKAKEKKQLALPIKKPLALPPLATAKPSPISKPGLGQLNFSGLKEKSSPSSSPANSARFRLPLNTLPSESPREDLKPLPERLKEESVVCSQVLESLFQAGNDVAKNLEYLKSLSITHVLNAGALAVPNYFPTEFIYNPLYILDGNTEDISCLFLPVLEWLDETISAGGRVLIHCHQGVSRSSSMTICYLIWKKRISFGAAHEFLKKIRSTANPNAGFISQLMIWEKRIHKEKPVEKPRLLRMTPHSPNRPSFIVAKEIPKISVSSLDPRFSFILQTKDAFHLWIGKDCPEILQQEAQRAIKRIQKYETAATKVKVSQQGQEAADFWSAFIESSPRAPPVSSMVTILQSPRVTQQKQQGMFDQEQSRRSSPQKSLPINEGYNEDFQILVSCFSKMSSHENPSVSV